MIVNRNKTCQVEGCSNTARCRGFCTTHYSDIYYTRVFLKEYTKKHYPRLKNLVVEG